MSKSLRKRILGLLDSNAAISGHDLYEKLNKGLKWDRYPKNAVQRSLSKLTKEGFLVVEKRPVMVEISHYRLIEGGGDV